MKVVVESPRKQFVVKRGEYSMNWGGGGGEMESVAEVFVHNTRVTPSLINGRRLPTRGANDVSSRLPPSRVPPIVQLKRTYQK